MDFGRPVDIGYYYVVVFIRVGLTLLLGTTDNRQERWLWWSMARGGLGVFLLRDMQTGRGAAKVSFALSVSQASQGWIMMILFGACFWVG
jgi:hypothetical protein